MKSIVVTYNANLCGALSHSSFLISLRVRVLFSRLSDYSLAQSALIVVMALSLRMAQLHLRVLREGLWGLECTFCCPELETCPYIPRSPVSCVLVCCGELVHAHILNRTNGFSLFCSNPHRTRRLLWVISYSYGPTL